MYLNREMKIKNKDLENPIIRHLSLLGATGSIGNSTLSVIRKYPERFQLHSAAAAKNWKALLPLIAEFKLKRICLFDALAAKEARTQCNIEVLEGLDGLCALAADPEIDYVVNGLMGAVGCKPTLSAIEHGKSVGLANKETMVMAGTVINRRLMEFPKATVIPIDSEHSAIFQCLAGRPHSEVESIQLTASGGPFRTLPKDQFEHITKAQALKHPTWVMGQKITIDSATLMNKGLEVIEAHFLFDMPMERIEVVVHPSSIVHSLVQFQDGSLMAQLGCPDMRLPIQYAMTYPERWPLAVERIDLKSLGKLEFFAPDTDKFPCLALAYEAGRMGGNAPAIINAANEVAVDLFLREKIAFNDIAELVATTLQSGEITENPDLENVLQSDAWARQQVQASKLVGRRVYA